MFENTLLIIKSDYMSRRKCLLLHLLSKGFQIQGSRKLAFTPEDAAEFYKDLSDDKCYMLYVILLSKGTSEAFILTKENAVQELLHTMVCYFGTSVEMDRNVHVSRSDDAARREITFIFPNYIHEPLPLFDRHRFCHQKMIGPILGEVYDIVQTPIPDPEMNWRTKLSDWLIKANTALPHVSNQCSTRPQIGFQSKHQQTDPVQFKGDKSATQLSARSTSSRDSSGLLTSTSCVSCSSFEREEKEPCPADLAEFEARLKMRATKTLEEPCKKAEDEKLVCDEHIEWAKVDEYEDAGVGEEEGAELPAIMEAEDYADECDIAEQLSFASMEERVQEMEEEICNPAIEEQIEVEHVLEDTLDELQVEEQIEPAPPAEGAVIENKQILEDEAPAIQVEAAPVAEGATEVEPPAEAGSAIAEQAAEETIVAAEPDKTEEAPETV